jgi:hypothetical protein
MLKPAALQGSLLFGPPQGQSVTFVRPDAWLPFWKELDSGEAWREIVRRYLRAYGPVARGAGQVVGHAASAGRARAGGLRRPARRGGRRGYRAWALAEDIAGMQAASPRVPARLLGGFDVYVAGTRPKGSLVDRRFEDRVFRKAGWVSPVVLVDGMVAGVWGHERSGGRIQVTVEPFQRLSGEQRRQLGEEADRLGSFLGAAATISYSG